MLVELVTCRLESVSYCKYLRLVVHCAGTKKDREAMVAATVRKHTGKTNITAYWTLSSTTAVCPLCFRALGLIDVFFF